MRFYFYLTQTTGTVYKYSQNLCISTTLHAAHNNPNVVVVHHIMPEPVSPAPNGSTPAPNVMPPTDPSKPKPAVLSPLRYSWDQTDGKVKIYISLDQIEDDGTAPITASDVQLACPDEWTMDVSVKNAYGLKIPNLQQRIVVEEAAFKLSKSRITLTLPKQAKEHWFNLVMKRG